VYTVLYTAELFRVVARHQLRLHIVATAIMVILFYAIAFDFPHKLFWLRLFYLLTIKPTCENYFFARVFLRVLYIYIYIHPCARCGGPLFA